jgi:hypothetical protein
MQPYFYDPRNRDGIQIFFLFVSFYLSSTSLEKVSLFTDFEASMWYTLNCTIIRISKHHSAFQLISSGMKFVIKQRGKMSIAH